MQVRTITVNAANLTTAGSGIQGTGFPVGITVCLARSVR